MTNARHRDFDFWIGEWEVTDPAGTPAGRNRIQQVFGGVGLSEHWEGAGGQLGTSLNVFSESRGHWHQTWIDSSGTLLQLDGGLRDGAMVLEGTTPGREDPRATVQHRISWSTMDGNPDLVRQHWEVSKDAGSTWETLFDGRYRRIGGAEAPGG